MFPSAQKTAITEQLLSEVSSAVLFQHSTLWIYASLGGFALLCLAAGYLVVRVVDRADRRSGRPGSSPSLHPTPLG